MARTTTLRVRLDADLKTRSEKLFRGIGLDTPTAVRLFLQSVARNGLPFPVDRGQDATAALGGFTPFPALAELEAEAERKYQERKASGRRAFEGLYGCMPAAGGDPVKYQRDLRDEWPD